MTSKFLMFHVPEDKELLAALGIVTLRHEHLNHMLKMTIKVIANISLPEAVDATQYEGSSTLRDRVKKLARQRLGEGTPMLKIQAMANRAGKLTKQRNKLMHGIWAKEPDGDPGVMGMYGELNPLPTVEQLQTLAKEIEQLTKEFDDARLTGFLYTALENKAKI